MNMTMIQSTRRLGLQITLVGSIAALWGCLGGQGSTDGGSGADNNSRGSVFVADETTTGGLEIEVEEASIAVGDTSGFFVRVQNARQDGVSNINVACDSEAGVAIIEPQTGYELTNGAGVMSGVIGCERPGSFQLVCRLSVGANRRKFVSVRCTGDIPSGFQGFPGAGGGGLGGGAQTNDDGDVRIVSTGFVDDGDSLAADVATSESIDIVQDFDCDNLPTTVDIEPFYDTYVKLKVQNNLAERVRFSYLQYSVSNVDGNGTEFTSKRLGITQEIDSSLSTEGGTSTTIFVPVFKIYNGGKYVGDPLGVGIQITNSSFQTVSFSLVGETASGDSVEVNAQATASFSNFTRCSSVVSN
jgi:hypothetical protein